MDSDRLRAYGAPPFRAEEWIFYSGYQVRAATEGPDGLLAITPNGLRAVPNGYRGVISVVNIESISNRANYAFDDLSDGNRYDLRVNGVAVPGYANRPISSRLTFYPFQGTLAGSALDFESYGYLGVISPVVIVPTRIRSGDALSIKFRPTSTITDTLTAVLVQGYWWPAADEDERAAGNLADPIP